MSLRKFMHERNKYREKPDFKKLAILYPEFRKIAITDISGKVSINFKNEESLKVLTKTLLKHDFNLEVEIPPNKLVPALPLRLNYILWIEDLLKHSGIDDLSLTHGIDIGTGAICIYPLLFSKIFKNKMTCTDIDSDSIEFALKNIENNNLQDLIKAKLVNKESILEEVIQEHDRYSFVMCNPPFFETDKGLGKQSKQEPPRNAPTGNETELEVKGGEKEFILRLVEESLSYKDHIQIYTTMFGQKNSLAFLRNVLTKKGIVNTTWTEFCQGYTKRWGIAWTFISKDKVDLRTAPVIRTRTEVLKLKKNKSMEIIFPIKDNLNTLKEIIVLLKQFINELKIEMKEIQLNDEYDCWACQLTAYSDTWSHARRKRRMAMRDEILKKQCLETLELDQQADKNKAQETPESESINMEKSEPLLVCTVLVGEKNSGENSDEESESSCDEDDKTKKIFKISMIFENGHGGKLSLETLRQFFINKLNIRDYFQKQQQNKSIAKKRKRERKKN